MTRSKPITKSRLGQTNVTSAVHSSVRQGPRGRSDGAAPADERVAVGVFIVPDLQEFLLGDGGAAGLVDIGRLLVFLGNVTHLDVTEFSRLESCTPCRSRCR